MVKALFAGSFDPPTYGHLDVILRSSKIFTELHVLLAVNKRKSYLFSLEERLDMLEKLVGEYSNVSVSVWDSLIVEYAKAHDIKVLVRGLDKEIETLFLPPDPSYFVLRSSSIRELASLGGDLSSMVPPLVEEKLKEKVALNYL